MARKEGFKQGKVAKIKMPISAGSWLTNVGKSIGMGSMDVLRDIMPASVEIASSAAESVSNLRNDLDQLRAQRTRLSQAMDRNVYMDILRTAAKNTIEDAKSGNIYHGMSYDDGLGDMDMDFDMGDEWDVGDDSDYDANFESEDGMTTVSTKHSSGKDIDVNNVRVNVDIGNNSKLAQSLDNQAKIAVDNAKISMEYNKAFNKTLLAQMTQIGDRQSSILGSIDSNVSSIVSVGETLAKSASLSIKYFDDSMAVFNNIYQALSEIKDSVAGSGKPGADMSRYDGKYNNVVDDLFSGNGILDPKAYMEVAKKQLKSAAESNLIISQLMNVASDTDTLKAILAHPLDYVTKGIVKVFIPQMMRQAAENFDNTLKEVMITGLHRIRGLRESDNPVLSFLGEAFGITNKLKTDVDKSNYNRGKVDWNGESHKTLNEVIPYYLRKIASAVSGTEEVAFDYDKGKFAKLSTIQKEYKEEDNRRMIREFSSLVSDFKESLDKNVQFTSKDAKENTIKDMEAMLRKVVMKDGTGAYRKNDSFLQYISDLMGKPTSDPSVQLISGFIDSRRNDEVLSLFGRGALEARAAYSKYKLGQESGEITSNSRYVDTGLGAPNVNVKLNSRTGEFEGINYKVSPFIEHDKYGKTPAYYLRDIYKLLLGGIAVFPVNDMKSAEYNRKRADDQKKYEDRIAKRNTELSEIDSQYLEGWKPRTSVGETIITEQQKEAARAKGKTVVGDGHEDENLYSSFGQKAKLDREESERADIKDNWFVKLTNIDSNKPISKMMYQITEFFKKPGELGTKLFHTADQFLFKLVFGGKEEGPGMFKTGLAYIKKGFGKFSLWINDHILQPLHDKLFGEDGLFEQFKKSKMYDDMKNGWGKFVSFLLGTKGTDGNRHGGLFSETANELSSIGRDIKFSLFGKDNPDSVLANVKRVGTEATDSVLGAFGIDVEELKEKRKDPKYSPIKDAVTEVTTHIKSRAGNALDMLFGAIGDSGENESDKKARQEFADGVKQDLKNAGAGKIGAGALIGGVSAAFLGGKLGFVSSVFLPGGFVGGALMGLGLSIVKNSSTVQKLLFGDIDEDGQREGGIISKEVYNAVKDNNKGIAIGAVGGLAGSLGIIPSFLLPGGPVGGALIGMGVSMAMKSQVIQDFLFGNEEDGKEGLARKFTNLFKNADGVTDKARFLDTGIGAGIGLVGSMFLPTGPFTTAILGGAAGFLSSSEGFQKFLFGEKDQDGKRSGGIVGKAVNAIKEKTVPFIKSAQNKMLGWLERGIVQPLQNAFMPIANLAKSLVVGIVDKASNMFKFIGYSIRNFLIGDGKNKKGILSPLIGIGKFIGNATKNVALSIVQAPFKLIEGVAKAIDLGTRIKNITSHLIAPFAQVATKLLLNPVRKLSNLIKDGISKMWDVVSPFKNIGRLFNLFKNIGKGISNGLDWVENNTAVGKTVGKVRGWFTKKRSQIGGTLGGLATSRMRLQKDENGNYYYGIDKDYKYSNTKTGESISHRGKRWAQESRDWQEYKNYFQGTAADKKRAEKYFRRTRGAQGFEELLNSGANYTGDRLKFDELFGHQSDGWKKSTKYAKKDEEKRADANSKIMAEQIVMQNAQTNHMTVAELSVSDSSVQKIARDFFENVASRSNSKLNEYLNEDDANPNSFKAKVLRQTAKSSSRYAKSLDKLYHDTKAKEYEDLFFDENGNLKPIEGTTASDMAAGVTPEETTPEDSGQKAFGGTILETGKYWLSKGEKVVSNIRDKWKDYKREKSLKNQYNNMLGDNNFTNEDTGEATDAVNSSFAGKTKAEENAELTAKIAKNGYNREKVEEKKLQDIERAEQSSFREKILSAVDGLNTKFGEYRESWDGIFGKKGLITLGVIAAGTLLSKLLGKDFIINVANAIGDTIVQLADGVDTALKNVGGIKGIFNNVGEAANKFLKLFTGNDPEHNTAKEVSVNPDGTINLNPDGTVAYRPDENEISRSIPQKIYDFLFPQQTRIDIDGSVTGTPGAAYTMENTYDAASGAKLTAVAKLTRKPAHWLVKNGGNISRGAGNVLNHGIQNAGRIVGNITGGDAKAYYQLMREAGGKAGTGMGKVGAALSTVKETVFGDMRNVAKATDAVADNQGLVKTSLAYAKKGATGLKNAGSQLVDLATTKGKAAVEKGGKIAGDILEKFPKAQSLFETFLKYARKALDALQSRMTAMLKKKGVKNVSKIADKISDGLSRLTGSNFFKLGKQFILDGLSGISKAITKTAVAAASFLTTDLGMGIAGGLLGAANAENMFVADFDNMDFATKAKLRLVAGVFQGFLNTSIGGWLDLANSIIYMITNFNLVSEIATIAFNLIASEEEQAALKNAQDDFQSEYEEYLEKEYEAYAQHAAENGAEVMDFETFKQSEVSTSIDDYNAEQHKTVGAKVWGGIKKGASVVATGVKKGASAIGVGMKAVGSVGNLIMHPVQSLKNGITAAVESLQDTKFGQTLAALLKSVSSIGSFIKSDLANTGKWINGEIDKMPPIQIDENDPLFQIKKSVGTGLRTVSFLPALIMKGGNTLYKKFLKPIVDGLKTLHTLGKEDRADMFSKIDGISSIFKGEFWAPPAGKEDGIPGLARNIIFYTNRIGNIFPAAIYGTGKSIINGVKKIVNGVKTLAIAQIEDTTSMYKSIDGIGSIFKGAYWTAPEEPTTIPGLMRNVLFYSHRVMSLPQAAVHGVIKSGAKVVKGVIEKVKPLALANIEDTKSMYSGITGISSIFKGAYWTPPEESESGIDGLFRSILFYGHRITSLPSAAVYGLTRSGLNLLKGVVNAYKAVKAADLEDNKSMYEGITGISSIFKGAYWTPPKESESGISGPLRSILFYGHRIFNIIPAIQYGLLTSAKTKFNEIVDGIKNVHDLGKKGFDISNVKPGSNDYWKLPSGIKPGTFGGAISTLEFLIARTIMYIPYKIQELMDSVKEKIGDVAKTLGVEDWFTVETTTSGNGGRRSLSGNGDVPDTENGFPYYSQNDPSLKNKPYKMSGRGKTSIDETMGMRGCGPTALAMVASKVKGGYGNPYTPENMARLAEQGNYSTSAGTTPGYFMDVGSKLGMRVTPATATANNITALVGSGQPVILQGQSKNSSSPFTSSGHYVVGVGMDGNGNLIVNDPNGRASSRAYPMSTIAKDANLAFGFSDKYGGYGPKTNLSNDDIVQMMKNEGITLTKSGSNNKSDAVNVNLFNDFMASNTAASAASSTTSSSTASSSNTAKTSGASAEKLAEINERYKKNNDRMATHMSDTGKGSVPSSVQNQEKAVINCMAGLEGKNTYTQSSDRSRVGEAYSNGHGYGDCSSTCRWVYQTCLGVDIGGYTGAQVANDAVSYKVDTNTGSGPNESNLRPGDLLFYSGNSSNPYGVGHVEMYIGNGTIMGHGSGKGPTKKSLSNYRTKEYMWARRVIKEGVTQLTEAGKEFARGKYNGKSIGTVSYNASDYNSTSSILGSTDTTMTSSVDRSSMSSIFGQLASAFMEPIKAKLYGTSDGSLSGDNTGVTSYVTSSYNSDAANYNNITAHTDQNTRRDAVYKKLRSMGYSKEAASGIMGNIEAESGFNPAAVGDGGHAYGLAQWHNYAGKSGRWLNMSNYANSIGSNYTNLGAQTEFIDRELDPSCPFSDSIATKALKNKFGSMAGFRGSNSISDVTALVMTKYERPLDQSTSAINKRIDRSRRIYETYKNNEPNVDLTGLGGFGDNFSKADKPINYRVPMKKGGFGQAKLDYTLKHHDDRLKQNGGFGDVYDDTGVKELLKSMLTEMQGTNEGINKFNDKDFGGNGTINYYDNKSSNTVEVPKSEAPSKTYQKPASMINPQVYAIAKKISSGKVTM